jgi:Tfp pilus assembly protein PilV
MRRPPPTNRALAGRRGITITEVLIACVGVAIIMGLSAVSIQLMMKLNADLQRRYGAAAGFERLARILRDDARSGETAIVTSAPKTTGNSAMLRLAMGKDHAIEYQGATASVTRTEMKGGKPVAHETVSLPRGTAAQFELRKDGTRTFVVLVTSQAAGKSPIEQGSFEPARTLEIVAQLGKDRVLATAARGGKP